MLELIIEFFTFAFPKAGILLGPIPITVALILLAIYIFFHADIVLNTIANKRLLGCPYIFFLMVFVFSCLLNYGSAVFTAKMAEGILYIISPLAVVVGLRVESDRAYKVICASAVGVGIFALIQFLVGIESTKIPGLTIQLGDSYINKTIGYSIDSIHTAAKMPSTYQIGNSMGVFLLQVFLMVLWNTIDHVVSINKTFQYTALIACLIGIFLSGSRSVILALIIISVLVIFYTMKRLSPKHFFSIFLVFLAFIVGFVIIDNYKKLGIMDQMYQRYIYNTFFAVGSTAGTAGRGVQYKAFLKRILSLNLLEILRFVFIGLDWNSNVDLEGFLYVMSYYGIAGFVAFMIPITRAVKAGFEYNKYWGYSFLSACIVLCVDRTFCSTPTLMNYYLLFGLTMQLIRRKRSVNR